MQDEEFLKEIVVLETIEEVQQAFKEKDVDISIEDLEKIRELIIKSMDNNYELSEEELEKICAGFAITGALIFIAKALLTGALGVVGSSLAKNGYLNKAKIWYIKICLI